MFLILSDELQLTTRLDSWQSILATAILYTCKYDPQYFTPYYSDIQTSAQSRCHWIFPIEHKKFQHLADIVKNMDWFACDFPWQFVKTSCFAVKADVQGAFKCTFIYLIVSSKPKKNCRTPDQAKIKIKSHQKTGKALWLPGFLLSSFLSCHAENSSDVTLAFENAD